MNQLSPIVPGWNQSTTDFIEFRYGTEYANHSTIQNCVIDGLIGASTSTTSVKHLQVSI